MSAIRHGMASTVLAMTMICCPSIVQAEESGGQKVRYDLPAQPLSDALLFVGGVTKRQIVFPGEAMAGVKAPEIHGSYSVREVVTLLLEGSGFVAEFSPEAIYISGRSEASSPSREAIDAGDAITVTGSRIKGAVTSSLVFRYDTQQMRDQGVADMRSLAATIPQNFTGGQNPGVGNGAESRGSVNGNSSTGLNLRGLGPGATLTLLNGHRLAYNQNNNSVDFSSIPFAAVERVEIMPDGASAIYGSDAVGGVANIILKKGYDGLWTNTTIGGATEGGYLTQSFNAVTGTHWQGGSGMLSANYDRNTGVTAGQRSVTSASNPDLSLFPRMKSYGFVGSVHQDVLKNVTVSVDALYSARDAFNQVAYSATAPASVSGAFRTSKSWTLNLAPSLAAKVGPWSLTLVGVYGKTRSDTDDVRYPGALLFPATLTNATKVIEASGEGPLIQVPAGDIRLAVGGGARRDDLMSLVSGSYVRAHQDNYFAYGELNIPVTSPDQKVWGAYRANIDMAVRYEDYPGAGRLATPRVGFSWAPVPDVEFKGSWGRSFRVPTLYQRYYQPYVVLFPGDLYGTRVAPAGQTLLVLGGGNPDLKPEKATTWSGTVALHPRAIPNLDIGVSFFKVNYTNRIATPISSFAGALTDPSFAQLIEFNPSLSTIASTIARSPTGLDDQTLWGAPFDPTSVYAIYDYRYQNVSRDRIHGLDVSANYSFDMGDVGTFALQASGTYLVSERVVIAGKPAIQLAGTVFYPPHVKARGGLTWTKGETTINGILTYIGGIKDNRLATVADIDGMTTFDLAIKRRFGGKDGIELQVSGLNLFNAKPDTIRGTGINQPYDSTNYSVLGRYVSLSMTASF